MATHSSILAWEIPWTEEPGRIQSIGSQRVGHDWSDLAQTAACQASLSFTISQSLLKLMSTESVMLSSHLILFGPLLLLPSIFPSIRVFQMNQLFTSSGQSIGVSLSISALPVNNQGWFFSGLTGLISLLSKGLSRVFSSTTIWKHQFFSAQPSLWCNSHICTWPLEKP